MVLTRSNVTSGDRRLGGGPGEGGGVVTKYRVSNSLVTQTDRILGKNRKFEYIKTST